MGIVLMIHSLLRWLIVAVAVIAVVKYAVGLLRATAWQGMDRGLLAGYTGLLDLQALLGLILLVWGGLAGQGWPLFRIEHAVVMIAAVAAAHMLGRNKAGEPRVLYRRGLLAIVVSLLLIVVGVFTLPQGWFG